jgi:hypothetical protein
MLTNIEHQSLCGRFLSFHSVLAHAMHNGAYEIDAKAGVDVHQMKNNRDEQEPIPPELRHDDGWQKKKSGDVVRNAT